MVASLYGVDQETKSIWVYLEVDGEVLAGVTLELIAKGREICDELGWDLVGLLLIGHQWCRQTEGSYNQNNDHRSRHSLLPFGFSFNTHPTGILTHQATARDRNPRGTDPKGSLLLQPSSTPYYIGTTATALDRRHD